MSKLVIDVECNEALENYDTIIYFNGKWTVVNRSSYMAHEVKQRLALQQRFEDLEVELKNKLFLPKFKLKNIIMCDNIKLLRGDYNV